MPLYFGSLDESYVYAYVYAYAYVYVYAKPALVKWSCRKTCLLFTNDMYFFAASL
mgnify:FL=1